MYGGGRKERPKAVRHTGDFSEIPDLFLVEAFPGILR